MLSAESLKKIDFAHLWHPFTQAKMWFEENDPLIVEHAKGVEIFDIQGRAYLDGISSLWCNVHGHGVPTLVQAIKNQAETLCHSTILGLSHRPIIELTDALIKIVPLGLNRVFYADSGSTAVEAALRMCIEWWERTGNSRRKKIISLQDAYHGDTLGAVGVGYSEVFHRRLNNAVVPALRVPTPHVFRFYEDRSEKDATEESLFHLKKILESEHENIAAMIIEPLVQGAAGIWIHSVNFLESAFKLCKQYDVLFVADEVATGFGKTGKMFAVQQANICPDILVIGKSLSAGYLPISAAITREEIFEGFVGEPEEYKTFFYGQTFAGNPLAAAVSKANIELFIENKVIESMPARIQHFHAEIEKNIRRLTQVSEVRYCGFMVGIELTAEKGKKVPFPVAQKVGPRIVREARKRGAIIRPLGNVIVLMPALAMSEQDLTRLVKITADSIEAVG